MPRCGGSSVTTRRSLNDLKPAHYIHQMQWAGKLTSCCAVFFNEYGRGWLLAVQWCSYRMHAQGNHEHQQQSSDYRTNRFPGHLTPPWNVGARRGVPPAASLKATGFEDARLGFMVQGRWVAIVIFHP
jgi:hypothetical protein